ncbi:fimbrial chaperone protein StbB [Enterobacter sp. SGAir0187]|uniref:fimbrial biogenesis chaperone n=1 Tax=Enterobacter sp. SGAir0187 TaxID=2836161 RepID=UPI000CEB39F9|nr:fimbria/pilus periplasmic chaperone [Enterobacter sp. SGAir0187]AVH17539.1 fimbrial chaperone protein StbB [Enterobacter sp. SGAir0187]
MQHNLFVRAVVAVALLISLFVYKNVNATVIMIGSRVIYHAEDQSVDIQLRNRDNFPYVIQAWLDNGDIESTPATGKSPFMITPASFRIAANEGQVLRLSKVGNVSLPKDRESVFYFNFLQIPPSNLGGEKKNKIMLMLKNRVKVFYRPEEINANPKKISDMLSFISTENGLTIKNNSPFFLTLAEIKIDKKVQKGKIPMIPPFESQNVTINHDAALKGKQSKLEITHINDYGARVANEYDIQF